MMNLHVENKQIFVGDVRIVGVCQFFCIPHWRYRSHFLVLHVRYASRIRHHLSIRPSSIGGIIDGSLIDRRQYLYE